jgi:hypothetical protein
MTVESKKLMEDFEQMPEMTEWQESKLIVPVSQLGFHETKPNYNIIFSNRDGEVARFDFNGPALQFSGNAEEGALLFINWATTIFDQRLKDEYARGYNDAKAGMF